MVSSVEDSIDPLESFNSPKAPIRIAPHDLRRRFAKLAQGHAALQQIQISLGDSLIQTTERYLGVEQDLTDKRTGKQAEEDREEKYEEGGRTE